MSENSRIEETEPVGLVGFLALVVCMVGVPAAIGAALLAWLVGA